MQNASKFVLNVKARGFYPFALSCLRAFAPLLFCLIGATAFGQLTIEQCYEKARDNYPLVSRYKLIEQSEGYNLQNASKGYLPQFSLSAKATYQTEVTTIPISVPGINVPTLRKDQYQIVAGLSQTIWDGGVISSQKKNIKAGSDSDKMKYEVDMYALNARINDLFFGILLLNEQLRLNDVYMSDLQRNHNRVASFVANGLANSADLDAIGIELLIAKQSRTNMESMRKAFFQMLSVMTGVEMDTSTALTVPDIDLKQKQSAVFLRPELFLYDAMTRQMEAQRKSITAGNLPKINAFIQAGYAEPGLNIFQEGFSPYAIGGVQFLWNFGSLYTRKNDLNKINTNINDIEIQRETFLFNTSLQTTQQQFEIEKYLKIMEEDDQIITMRENIRRSAEAKVENGTMSVIDMMREVNAEQNARQQKATHKVELLKALYELKNKLGIELNK
jgi:outer membrane protein TolC